MLVKRQLSEKREGKYNKLIWMKLNVVGVLTDMVVAAFKYDSTILMSSYFAFTFTTQL